MDRLGGWMENSNGMALRVIGPLVAMPSELLAVSV
jgi:hypothetical protein